MFTDNPLETPLCTLRFPACWQGCVWTLWPCLSRDEARSCTKSRIMGTRRTQRI